MNAVHDVGGVPGLGGVEPEPDEPVFHAEWERRVFAMHVAMGATGEWTLDGVRAARESIPPPGFLSLSYYETFLAAIQRLAALHRLVSPDEIAAGHSLRDAKPRVRTLSADDVLGVLARGSSPERAAPHPARFGAGDVVRARDVEPVSHTRLPHYARGHIGTVVLVHGCHAFPDTRALGLGDDPQWLYTVRFDARELWGERADPTLSVSVDAFEPYLEPVG